MWEAYILSRGLLLVLLAGCSVAHAEEELQAGTSTHRPNRLPVAASFLEIKESTIPDAGLGLFVSEASGGPFKRGAVVTSYGGEEMAVEDASHEYAMSIPGNDDMVMVGKPWTGSVPHRVEKGLKVGHLCNDGAAALPPENANWPETGGLKALQAMAAEYERESKARANVKFVKGSWDMSAARDLQPGEELFLSYGLVYWLNRALYDASADPAARLVLYLFVIERAPDMFRAGFVMLDRVRQRPVLSTTGREIDEQYCQELLQDFLGFRGKEGRRAMKRLGVRPSKSATAKETFAQLVESVYRRRESMTAATEPQPPAEEAPGGVGQGGEPLTAAA